jgi:GntR family transcriptional repressor for pyruvate dehydrogenase complex
MDTDVKQETAPRMVVRQIQKEIESGRLKPGQKLPSQSAMAKMFGVGMSSIREAVNTLEVMGILEVTHGSGTFVKEDLPPDRRGLGRLEQELVGASPFELFELRELIECHVTRLAAQRVSDTGIQSIRDALAELADSIAGRQQFLEADMAFHMAICRAARQTAAGVIIRLLYDLVHQQFSLAHTTQTVEYRSRALETAKEVVDHIERGDEVGAMRCMRSHLDQAKDGLSSD